MKNLQKILAVVLCLSMVFSLCACSKKSGDVQPQQVVLENGDAAPVLTVQTGHNEDISIGTWWVQYYDSSNESIEVSSDYTTAITSIASDDPVKQAEGEVNKKIAELKWDNVKKIEDKYDVKFHWDNLTYSGVKESINTSIIAGSPDCDIYLVEASVGYPAQSNGLALDLKTVLPADHDLFTTQKVCKYVDLGDGKACLIKRIGGMNNTYPIGFNMQMLADANLEDPRDLWERGEWTWDKFNEYCVALTQDTDEDGNPDQFGFCGYVNDVLRELLMSNGATIASGDTQTLTDPKVAECLDEIYNLYNTLKVCAPYDYAYNGGSPSDSMRNQYTQGNVAMFPIAAWINSGNGDYDWTGEGDSTDLTWDMAYVRWPVGPSGNKDTNAGFNDNGGELYMIPANVQEPEVVFGVLYDMWNWYDGDTTLRDDPATVNWWYSVTARESMKELQMQNLAVQQDCMAHPQMDNYENLNVYFTEVEGVGLEQLVDGTCSPSQFQESYKQLIQDGLDKIFK